MDFTLTHEVSVAMPDRPTKLFRRTFKLPFAPHNGLRISIATAASFEIEHLAYLLDAGTMTYRTLR